MDDKGLTDEHEDRYGYFYGSLAIELAGHPQTILAVGMNGVPLPVEHGARSACGQRPNSASRWSSGSRASSSSTTSARSARAGRLAEDFQQYSTWAGI